MYLKQISVENFRLLNNVTIMLDQKLTLFVGKNNTGKTSIMELLNYLINNTSNLSFEDYPLESRKKLYSAILQYWSDTSDNSLNTFLENVPITKVNLVLDYSDGYIGNVSSFIIDLDENIFNANVLVSFEVSSDIENILLELKSQFDQIVSDDATDADKTEGLQKVVEQNFSSLFIIKIYAVNPSDNTDFLERKLKDLQDVFCFKTIRAERDMGESDITNLNPLSQLMKTLFRTELDDMETGLQATMQAINSTIIDTNYNLQRDINRHMSQIVDSMIPFGYPDNDDLTLKANTNLELKRTIIEDTELRYVSKDDDESLPSSHNGLGYKNLIKISLELHEFARLLKTDRTRLPLLFIEEPEAHMHPQLQTVFVSYIEQFLRNEVSDYSVQILMTTHSSHVANNVNFMNIRYIRRHSNYIDCKNMGDFSKSGDSDECAKRLDFLQKYMKLSYCDLYFCDKAILVEGASERLLIPDMISKCKANGDFDKTKIPLSSQYYSVVEIGGAYAHLFFDFVDYLEIPTLIITDIDFVKGSNNVCCKRIDAEKTSNETIKNWYRTLMNIDSTEPIEIDKILSLTDDQRSTPYRHIEFQKKEHSFHPRSLEDAIINCNRTLYGISASDEPDFTKLAMKKTDFALQLLTDDSFTHYCVPTYIKDGLVWLNNKSRLGE